MKINEELFYKALEKTGLTKEQIPGQIEMLKDLLILKTVEKLYEIKPAPILKSPDITPEKLQEYINNNFSESEYDQIVINVFLTEGKKYFEVISSELSRENKEEIISIFSESLQINE